MGKTKMNTRSQTNERNQHLKLIDPALLKFFVQAPQKLQCFLASHLRKPQIDRSDSPQAVTKKELNSIDWKANLEKQVQLWRQNPVWDGKPAEITVTVPKGSLCNLHAEADVGFPPDGIYNIVTDPDNKGVFKNIKEVVSRKVLIDEGSRQVVQLEQSAIWKFLWWSGTISVNVLVDQNREDHSLKFKQVNTGLMKRFEGCWRVEPIFVDEKLCSPYKPKTLSDYLSCTGGKGRVGSRVRLEQLLQPAVLPPPPLSWYLRGITTKTTETLINYLVEEVVRVKGVSDTSSNQDENSAEEISDEVKINETRDIKERWALRRRRGLVRRNK